MYKYPLRQTTLPTYIGLPLFAGILMLCSECVYISGYLCADASRKILLRAGDLRQIPHGFHPGSPPTPLSSPPLLFPQNVRRAMYPILHCFFINLTIDNFKPC